MSRRRKGLWELFLILVAFNMSVWWGWGGLGSVLDDLKV